MSFRTSSDPGLGPDKVVVWYMYARAVCEPWLRGILLASLEFCRPPGMIVCLNDRHEPPHCCQHVFKCPRIVTYRCPNVSQLEGVQGVGGYVAHVCGAILVDEYERMSCFMYLIVLIGILLNCGNVSQAAWECSKRWDWSFIWNKWREQLVFLHYTRLHTCVHI